MDFVNLPFILYLCTWITVSSGLWTLFSMSEDVLNAESKKAISQWLLCLWTLKTLNNWTSNFIIIFDGIFGNNNKFYKIIGEEHISFLRSSIASYISIFTVTLYWSVFHFQESFFLNGSFSFSEVLDIIAGVAIFGTVFNLIPDYISLVETRYILQLMDKYKSIATTLILLVLDFVITGLIFTLFFFIIAYLNHDNIYSAIGDIPKLFNFQKNDPSPTIFFYSTYFSSIWIYLYLISSFLYKFLKTLKVKFILKLDIENKPLKSIGFISVIITTFCFIVGPLLR